MPTGENLKLQIKRKNLFLRVSKGRFHKSRSHINYHIDVTAQKNRPFEVKAVIFSPALRKALIFF